MVIVIILSFITALFIAFAVFMYVVLKGVDKVNRSGRDPRHDDVDMEAIKKLRK